ncbi:casparian strip membrane protein 1-like [Prosopis cineraria]|uniref:casparian strip membrane protein 1-like n=1 Tax=Prosopis cineraria TaxID=364024 RepID=UPI00240ED376|nr:casparian strip membrane protein 1-like [Prosopis cineraria]
MKGSTSTVQAGEVSKGKASTKMMNRGLSVMDLILRIAAITATFGSAVAMATSHQRLPFVTQFLHFRAKFNDLPTFVFFVLGNSIVCGYLVLSIVFSIFHIARPTAVKSRILLLFLDAVAMGFLTSAAAAAAAIVETAHHGNPSTNWFPICQQYNSFCQRISGTLIGSFIAVIVLIILILISAVSISRIHA